MRLVWGLALLIGVGCSAEGGGGGWAGEVRDSAGIRIVENRGGGLWREGAAWRVTPALTIGGGEGAEDDLIAVPDLAVDSRGRVLVVDQIARQVRVFDESGVFEHAVGGPGEGPGELSRFLTSVFVDAHDSIFVPDWAQARVNVYSSSGEFARQMTGLVRIEGFGWRQLEAGGFLLRGVTIGRDEANRYTTYDALYRVSADLAAVDTLIEFDYPRSDLGGQGAPIAPLLVNAAFWTRLEDGRIAWSTLDRAQVLVHDASGALQAIVRYDGWSRRPLDADDRLTLRELFRQKFRTFGGDPNVVDNIELIYEETLPAITAVRAGPDTTLWVQRMGETAGIDPMSINTNDRTDGIGGPEWDVFDAQLRRLGTVTLPARFRIVHITADAIWGVRKDENDVELVERLDLQR